MGSFGNLHVYTLVLGVPKEKHAFFNRNLEGDAKDFLWKWNGHEIRFPMSDLDHIKSEKKLYMKEIDPSRPGGQICC